MAAIEFEHRNKFLLLFSKVYRKTFLKSLVLALFDMSAYWFTYAWLPKYLSPQIVQFINSRLGRDRCLWGTNGLPWKESLQQLEELGLKEEVKRKLLRENALQLFKLETASAAPARATAVAGD